MEEEIKKTVIHLEYGKRYEGETQNGKATGFGKIYNKEGTLIYEGYVVNGLYHGHGTEYFPSGNRYEGEFVSNQMQGEGVYIFADGTRIKDVWNNSVKKKELSEAQAKKMLKPFAFKVKLTAWVHIDFGHGYFDGEISPENKKDGYGILVKNNGVRYEGNFKNDRFNGKGVLIYADGSRYEGNFKDDLMHGKGVSYIAGGSIEKGQWKNGLKNGRFIHTFPDGRKVIWVYKDGRVSKVK